MMCRRCSGGCVVQEKEEKRQMPLIASCDKVDNLCGRCSGDVTCLDLVIGYIQLSINTTLECVEKVKVS